MITKSKSLRFLHIGNWNVDPKDARFSNTITDYGAGSIAKMIKENQSLRKLTISNLTRITDKGANALMVVVRGGHNKTLTDLYMENSTGVSKEKRDKMREGNKSSHAVEEGSLLTGSTEDPEGGMFWRPN